MDIDPAIHFCLITLTHAQILTEADALKSPQIRADLHQTYIVANDCHLTAIILATTQLKRHYLQLYSGVNVHFWLAYQTAPLFSGKGV